MLIPEQVEIAYGNNSHSSLCDVSQYWKEELKIRGSSMQVPLAMHYKGSLIEK